MPSTCAWSTCVTGAQPVTAWQDSHVLEVWKCVLALPVALTPSWHDAQFPVMPAWSYRAGVHAVLPWHAEHSCVVAT